MKLTVLFTLLLTGSVSLAGHLGYIFPAGGRAGETVEVLIGGQNNWGCNDIYVNTPGIKCLNYNRGVNVPFFQPERVLQAVSEGKISRQTHPAQTGKTG